MLAVMVTHDMTWLTISKCLATVAHAAPRSATAAAALGVRAMASPEAAGAAAGTRLWTGNGMLTRQVLCMEVTVGL